MPKLRFPDWQKPYQAALLETDHPRLRQKILEAEAAIFKRRQELSRDGDGHVDGSPQDGPATSFETLAISDALSTLTMLRNELQKKVLTK